MDQQSQSDLIVIVVHAHSIYGMTVHACYMCLVQPNYSVSDLINYKL